MSLLQDMLPGATALRRDGEYVLFRRAAQERADRILILANISEQPSPRGVERLKHEYALRDSLDSDWAAKPIAFTHEGGRSLLVLADPGGELLSRLLGRRWEVDVFLRVAISMATAVGRVHARGLIHKDIKPDHVLVNVASGDAWLMGFGIASRLVRERQAPDPPETIAGTLAYMAPEQTGRMNRSVDARSDLYALGVTFYQMITGELPFTAVDPMELVHCHIARQPPPPIERMPEVPAALSSIVVKLLAKTAEERYQTATGLANDLERCLALWEAGCGIEEQFALGEQDRPDRLLVPERLYGRERQIGTLLAAFDRVVAGGPAELVLVSGYSGIGKSAVVNELHKPLVPPRGLFASGKFDQYKRDIPYSTLAQAFQALIRRLLVLSDVDLAPWRDAVREALGPNGRLVTELVPELALIVGEQAPVPELPPQDARRRFQLVLRRFIGVFARREHPLALFLDDLQWLDAATLDLVEDLITQPDVKHLILIGAYRDNEVDATHPLMRKLHAMREAGASLSHIVLAPLTRGDLEEMVCDSLHCAADEGGRLAALVHERTGGNPFFVIQFITALADEGLITFDHGAARWTWDLSRIMAKGYTDNVVDLMVEKLCRLPRHSLEGLQLLACLGNSADFALLETVHSDSAQDLHGQLQAVLRTGLVLRSENSYRFLHDRVQEAAYSLIPESRRAEVHLRIGSLLAARTPVERREEVIFEIVNQLNRGAALIGSRDQREQLAELNLIAGRRAKDSAAYESALHYLVAGTSLLADGWQRRFDLMFALELQRAECEFLAGQAAAAEVRLTTLASKASCVVDRAAVACLLCDLYTTFNQSERALEVCVAYLGNLGIPWSAHPSESEARQEYERTWLLLGGRQIEELIDLPLMAQPEVRATMDVLVKSLAPAMFTDPNLTAMVLWRMVNLSLEHGNTDASCYAYTHVAVVAGPRFANYEAGFRFGRLGYDLVSKRGLRKFEARSVLAFATFVARWTQHLRASTHLLQESFDALSSGGDLTYAAYSLHNLMGNLLAVGDSLLDVEREADRALEFVRRIRFGIVIDNISTQRALVRVLRGATRSFGSFDDEEFDEAEIEERLTRSPGMDLPACWYWIRKLQARFFAGNFLEAVGASLKAQSLLWTSGLFLEMMEAHFYGALSHAACYESAPASERRQHIEAVVAHHSQLAARAGYCRENFENRERLVAAELARIEGRELDAERLYEAAIKSARNNHFVQNEALAYELAARFHSSRGFAEIGALYLRKARDGYLRWGAHGKVRQLDEANPQFREEDRALLPTSTIKASVEGLDLATVIKVSQALSGEIVLEKMLDTLMRIAIEHAGARRGLLILARSGEHSIVAEVTAEPGAVDVQMRNQSVGTGDLPQSVFHYVLHTHESVILDDAAAQGAFTSDQYVIEQRARSILCLPLLKQAMLIGVLYLENPLAARAFTSARIAVLDLLASQAAISLENARLYADLQKAHRLEAMGILAGGIAHDFNNILGAILGYGEMALSDEKAGPRLRRDLEAIMKAGERGRALVERVLAFSRSGSAERVPVHAEKVVRETLDLLAAQLTDVVRIDADLCTGRAAVLGDPTQIHQVVMNLGTNAAHAMPDGGVLTVRLRVERFETHRPATIGNIGKGEYIVLTVADTGLGIPALNIERIFDPFFTTKEVGSGTGLGLSLVHGIVNQLGGAIHVASVIGKGSTFTIYLPRAGDAPYSKHDTDRALPRGDGQSVMVVDDEKLLVRLSARILSELGYVPVTFTSSAAAFAALRDNPARFDALITDERMPGMSGCALARQVRGLRPTIPILLMSGFVGGGLMERARDAGVDDVLKKPLSAHGLATALARILRARVDPPSPSQLAT